MSLLVPGPPPWILGRIEGSHDRSEIMGLDKHLKVLSGDTVRSPSEDLGGPLLVLTQTGTSGM